MMRHHKRTGRVSPRDARDPRDAFTMIELLIVITILLLLTTFTAVAIDFTFQAERVRSGARQVQSLLVGARDRAVFTREARGVRFILDQDPENGRMVSSMIYVGASDPWNEGHITLMRPDFNRDGLVDDLDGDGNPETEIYMIEGSLETLWAKLKDRGYLGLYEDRNFNNTLDPGEDENGNGLLDLDAPRMKIPGDNSGTWYTVITYWLGRDATRPNRLQLISPYRDPGTTPADQIIAFEGTGPNTYILELPPRILPDVEPVLLPENVVIDIDASSVPGAWRPGDSTATHLAPCSGRMDVMFSPRGTVTGPEAAAGIIHFYVGQRDDTFAAMTAPAPRPPVNARGANTEPLVPVDGLFRDNRPVGDRSLVSLFTATGKVSSYPLVLDDSLNNWTGASGADNYADDPFVFAEKGK